MTSRAFFLLIILSPIWLGCGSSYSLKKHNDKLNRYYIEVKTVVGKLKNAIEKDIEIYQELKRVLQKPELFPYPSLSQLTQDMGKELPAMKNDLMIIQNILAQLVNLNRAHPSIEDSSPEYKQAAQLTKKFYSYLKTIQLQIQKLFLLHKNFHSLLKEYSIRRLSLKNQYRELKKLIVLSKQKTAMIQINSMRVQRKYPNEPGILEDFKKLFREVEALHDELVKEKKRFENYYLKQKYFWSGPGLKNMDGFIAESKSKLKQLIESFETKMQAF